MRKGQQAKRSALKAGAMEMDLAATDGRMKRVTSGGGGGGGSSYRGMSPAQVDMAVQKRRGLASRMYLQGKTIYAIAEALDVSVSTISHDLKVIRTQWLRATLENYDEIKARELAKLDALEAEYWEAWARSLEQAEEETVHSQIGQAQIDEAGIEDEYGRPVVLELDTARAKGKSRTTRKSFGDPRYLQGIERVLAQRAKLLGLSPEDRAKAVIGAGRMTIRLEWDAPAVIETQGTTHALLPQHAPTIIDIDPIQEAAGGDEGRD